MIRIVRWLRRRTSGPVATCVLCGDALAPCPRCDGRWSQVRCDSCLLGQVCPRHRRHRL